MEEIWKDMVHNGQPVGRKISNTGRVVTDTDRELKLHDNGAGYLYCNYATVNKRSVRDYIHRLVAKYFLPNPFNLPQVNHKDCDKSNNHVSNLEWISGRHNIDHAHKSGRMKKRSEYGPITYLTPEEVVDCYTRVMNGEGISAVARSMGKSRTTISSIINKRSRSDITDRIDEELRQKRLAA